MTIYRETVGRVRRNIQQQINGEKYGGSDNYLYLCTHYQPKTVKLSMNKNTRPMVACKARIMITTLLTFVALTGCAARKLRRSSKRYLNIKY